MFFASSFHDPTVYPQHLFPLLKTYAFTAALALSLKEAARDYDEYSLRLMNHTGIPFFRRNKVVH